MVEAGVGSVEELVRFFTRDSLIRILRKYRIIT